MDVVVKHPDVFPFRFLVDLVFLAVGVVSGLRSFLRVGALAFGFLGLFLACLLLLGFVVLGVHVLDAAVLRDLHLVLEEGKHH